ncbi:MAG: hypothetical protein GYA43_02335, partial [Bacteroidales bacterium]|nr:hypothetical protein [Bacteroidales bacterium]
EGILSFLSLVTITLLLKGCEGSWDTIDPESFKTWEYFTTQNGLASDSVKVLAEDSEGNIWVGTLDNGVSKYDGKEWTIYNEENGLLDNDIWSIAQDGNGYIWIGTSKGLSILANGTWTHIPEFGCVYALMKDYYDHMWVSSDNYYATEWDRDKWISWYDEEQDWSNYINVFFEDRERNIWFGAFGGLKKITGGRITYYDPDNGFPGGVVGSMYQDHWGNIWIGIGLAPFVVRYNKKAFERVNLDNGLKLNNITSISSDNEENLWFGEDNHGAIKYNGSLMDTYSKKDGLPGLLVTSIIRDREGFLWFGTLDGGVARYMPGLD